MNNVLVTGREITVDEVQHQHMYYIETERGGRGLVKADVQEGWTEKHPRFVYFVEDSLIPKMLPGDRITKIFEAPNNEY